MGLFKKKAKAEVGLGDLALNYVSDGVVMLGADGRVVLINPAAQAIIGQGHEEVVGVSFWSAVRLVDARGKEVSEELNPVAVALRSRTEGVIRDLSVVPKGSDKTIPVELVVRLAEGAAILTMRNIARELKEETERSDFISTASHEMRTPVASIEGFLGLAINPQTATIDERARNYLTQAYESSRHLGKLFQDLLDTTKLDDGRAGAKLVPVEMGAAVAAVANTMAPVVAGKGLKYVFDNGAGGARAVSPVLYAAVDVDFLRQILCNLIDNAVKYTPRGEVRVSVRGDEGQVVTCVADTGIGIDTADLPHVFQKFYRADNSDTRVIGGSGLGLYIVKKLAEAMGGKVWVESRLGEGSRFYVAVPRLSPEEYERRKLVMENAAKMVGGGGVAGAGAGANAAAK